MHRSDLRLRGVVAGARWRGAIAGGRERSEVEKNDLMWRGAISGQDGG